MPINMIAVPGSAIVRTPIDALGPAHGLTASKVRMLARYFGLRSVATSSAPHPTMCAAPLTALVDRYPGLRDSQGLLIYAKTQTHNTLADVAWLAGLADDQGLSDWETMTLSMNHCASGLSACHLLLETRETRPVVVLTGEKSFHASTCRQSSAALGELPVALLLNHGPGSWQIVGTRVAHAPRYYANPDRMSPEVRREFESNFGLYLQDFLADCVREFSLAGAAPPDIVVPYNLNLPLLRRLAEHFGWADRLFTETIATIGHLYCSDVFYNLAQLLPKTRARRVLCFAAGMGASFAALVIEKSRSGQSSPLCTTAT